MYIYFVGKSICSKSIKTCLHETGRCPLKIIVTFREGKKLRWEGGLQWYLFARKSEGNDAKL